MVLLPPYLVYMWKMYCSHFQPLVSHGVQGLKVWRVLWAAAAAGSWLVLQRGPQPCLAKQAEMFGSMSSCLHISPEERKIFVIRMSAAAARE